MACGLFSHPPSWPPGHFKKAPTARVIDIYDPRLKTHLDKYGMTKKEDYFKRSTFYIFSFDAHLQDTGGCLNVNKSTGIKYDFTMTMKANGFYILNKHLSYIDFYHSGVKNHFSNSSDAVSVPDTSIPYAK